MGYLTLTIDNTDNAAFDDKHCEIARIIREAAGKIDGSRLSDTSFKLRDYNGNTVGSVSYDEHRDAVDAPVSLSIKTDNAAFEENGAAEVARILFEAADHVERGYDTVSLKDANGNMVGQLDIIQDAPRQDVQSDRF